MTKYLFIFITTLILLLLGYGTYIQIKSLQNQQVRSDVLLVGTAADNPPYEFFKNDEIVGLDIDIIKLIGKDLGKKIVIKNLDFPGLLLALSSKQLDLVIAGLSKSNQREEHVDFSNVYLMSKVAVLFRANSNFSNCQDIQNKTIGAQLGTTWQKIAEDINKDSDNTKLRFLDNNLILVEELKSQIIDAVILEDIQAARFVADNPKLKKFVIDDYISEFVIASSKKSDLIPEINKSILKLQNNGVITELKQKWY
ncbi:bacterial extracellular solute-binding s, 3 family protein [Orientia chuto str. Dubai]|uniref:Bacterial extracellular solute-binding s, 3 family protein n=1 Tax=Orientia chuto str. Dubai TaxID=1359168 RepID=A0A0F3MJK4_9RICK|nr:ABC transporter substrate-binding protein [Candidatus Orientia mediorientalis]KJV55632.1 bacterial extracellular solute-binding s, 3 family protein [Orientia chuto str. Dubai]